VIHVYETLRSTLEENNKIGYDMPIPQIRITNGYFKKIGG